MVQMFRAFRAASHLFRLNRVPLTVRARMQRDGGAASIQSVRVKKARISRRYMLGSAIGVLILCRVFTKVAFAPLDELVDDLENEGGVPDSETPEDLNDSLFIPFPGTIKPIYQSPYRGSDPEWQEYMKFSKDVTLAKKVRADLAEITRRSVAEVKGGEGARILKHWLNIDYPNTPPPAYAHSGIEITDDFISWSTVVIDQETVLRIHQALFPIAVAKATWRFMQVLFSQDSEGKTKSIMYAHYKIPDPMEAKKTYPALASSDRKVTEEKVTQARVTGGVGITTHTSNYNQSAAEQTQGSADKQSIHDGEKVPQTQAGALSVAKSNVNQNGSEQPERKRIRDTMLYKRMARRCAHAMFTFKFTNNANWNHVRVIPRGSIVVSGVVELETKLNFVTVQVLGVWDPKTKAFDIGNSVIGVRQTRRKKQTPLLR